MHRPRVEKIPGGSVMVGRVVELTEQERRELAELAELLAKLGRTQRKGWFTPFVQSLARVNRLVQGAVGRSHAS